MGRLFGTDGARGVANTELSCELAMAIGRAAAMVLTDGERRPRVIIGKDTRASSDMLEAALAAGLCSVGADVTLLGVLPTPAVAYLVKKYGADAGVMISASHNPCEYNGIKLFNGDGFKLPDALEEEMEAIILDGAKPYPTPVGAAVGRVTYAKRSEEEYIRHLLSCVDGSLSGMRLAIDCANGSAAMTAKKLFSSLGAECEMLSDTPDGVNINDNCGSTHMAALTDYVKTHKVFAGIAFDGDADRCLMVDEQGNMVDGDRIIAALATHMQRQGVLEKDTAVVTVMSNLGFFRFCEQQGVQTRKTAVGDRYVLEEMLRGGYVLGGEQSGHIIDLRHATTGDGQLTALELLSACRQSGKKLSAFVGAMERYPQVLVNVKATATQKEAFRQNEALQAAIAAADEDLGKEGRVLVRVSGTEPLIRIMVEGRDFDEINRLAITLENTIRAALPTA